MDYASFGMKVRSFRKQHNFTQEQLAERIGISASFLGHIERGTRVASIETLLAICQTLQVSPHDLLASDLCNIPNRTPIPRKVLDKAYILLQTACELAK